MDDVRYRLAEDVDYPSVRAAVAVVAPVEDGPETTIPVTWLDTFDWRLWRAGCRLSLEGTPQQRRLVVVRSGASPWVLPVSRTPRRATDLPEGDVRDALAPLIENRALIPVGSLRVERRLLRVVDDEGNGRARLWWETAAAGDEAADATSIRLDAIPGEERLADGLRAALEASFELAPTAADDLDLAAAAGGRTPGDYSTKPAIQLERDEPAAESLGRILGVLHEVAAANVDGVLADVDVEFLHDLRVATRRARSALSQLKGVAEGEIVASLRDELRWLQGLTGSCRDLDVWLEEIPALVALLPEAQRPALSALERHVRDARRNELRRVRRGLRSERFERLLATWAEVSSDPPAGPRGPAPIGEVADDRIARAHRRILKKGRAIDDGSPAEALHRLRIDAKKLRYLLELLGSLYDGDAAGRFVRRLKKLQDLLGEHNDRSAQRERLHRFAAEMVDGGAARADTLLAMGRLEGELTRLQRRLRADFARTFGSFSGPKATTAFKAMLARDAGEPA